MKRPLTDLTLRKITPQRGTRVEIWDTHLPGFGMRMSETGVKTFVVMYRTGGVKRRLTLGRWPILPLAEAREKARDALKTAALGTDPQAQKRVAKEEQSGYRFSEVVRSFITLHCEQRNRPVTKRDTERILKNRFVGPLGKRDIREIRKADVLKILDGILAAGTPSAANHALAAVRKLFSWCPGH